MSIKGSASNLAQAVKHLSAGWGHTKTYWRDVKSIEFEKEYLEGLPHHVARAAAVIEEIDAILKKVRSDCE
jgi:hypothetical protein